MITAGLTAFEAASGVSPEKLSLFIRTFLLGLTFLWSAWQMVGLIHHLKYKEVQDFDLGWCLLRILFMVTIVMGLVFI